MRQQKGCWTWAWPEARRISPRLLVRLVGLTSPPRTGKPAGFQAAKKYRVDVGWLSADAHAVEPAFITRWREGDRWTTPVKNAAHTKAEQSRQTYLLPDEQTILDGFRLADETVKRTMLLLANDALARFGKRSQNHR